MKNLCMEPRLEPQNRGLGHHFLRHIERTKAIAYVLDCQTGNAGARPPAAAAAMPSAALRALPATAVLTPPCLPPSHLPALPPAGVPGPKSWEQLELLQRELAAHSPRLARLPAIVLANKAETLRAPERTLHALQRRTPLPVRRECACLARSFWIV